VKPKVKVNFDKILETQQLYNTDM
jgi:hypothetical protein